MAPTLEQDVEALAAELTDPEEARALVALLDLATAVDWQPGQDDGYRPFVYPH
jgi:hypothetical protein